MRKRYFTAELFGVNHTIITFCFCNLLSFLLEFLRKRLIVQKGPGVVELVVPCALKLLHCRNQIAELFIANQRKKGRIDTCGVLAIGGVVVVFGAP